MKKIQKGRPPRKRNREETVGVAVPSKSAKASPLAKYQFKPGNNANPAGRPRTSDLKAEVRAFADEADPKIRKTRLRVWLEMADRRARQGSPKHLEMLLAYGWGRPTTPLEHSGGIDLTDIIAKARKRDEAPDAFLPVPTSGTSDAQTYQAATDTAEQGPASEDDAEQPAKPATARRRIVVM